MNIGPLPKSPTLFQSIAACINGSSVFFRSEREFALYDTIMYTQHNALDLATFWLHDASV